MKPVHWIASSKKDLLGFPEDVVDSVGYALHLAENGEKSLNAVPLLGFGGASVLEIVVDEDGNTYRAVYTVNLSEAIYVLHCFQKKSKRGIETAKSDVALIKRRLLVAVEDNERLKKEAQKEIKDGFSSA